MSNNRTIVVDLEAAKALGPPAKGNLAVSVFAHGSLEVELYAPEGIDGQQPHSRDEVYVVAQGNGVFFDGGNRVPVLKVASFSCRPGRNIGSKTLAVTSQFG